MKNASPKGILKVQTKYGNDKRLFVSQSSSKESKYLEVLKNHGEQVLKKERMKRKQNSKHSGSGSKRKRKISTDESEDQISKDQQQQESVYEQSVSKNAEPIILIAEPQKQNELTRISNLSHSPHSPGARMTMQQSRLQDLCPIDKKKVGDLMKKLAEEKIEKEALKSKIERETSLFEDRLSILAKENQSILDTSQDLNSRLQQSFKLLQNYKQKTGEEIQTDGQFTPLVDNNKTPHSRQDSEYLLFKSSSENNMKKSLSQQSINRGKIGDQVTVPFVINKSTITGNMYTRSNKSIGREQRSRNNYEQRDIQTQDSLDAEVKDFLDQSSKRGFRESDMRQKENISRTNDEDRKVSSRKIKQDDSSVNINQKEKNSSFAKYVETNGENKLNEQKKGYLSNTSLIKKEISQKMSVLSQLNEKELAKETDLKKERVILRVNTGESEQMLKQKKRITENINQGSQQMDKSKDYENENTFKDIDELKKKMADLVENFKQMSLPSEREAKQEKEEYERGEDKVEFILKKNEQEFQGFNKKGWLFSTKQQDLSQLEDKRQQDLERSTSNTLEKLEQKKRDKLREQLKELRREEFLDSAATSLNQTQTHNYFQNNQIQQLISENNPPQNHDNLEKFSNINERNTNKSLPLYNIYNSSSPPQSANNSSYHHNQRANNNNNSHNRDMIFPKYQISKRLNTEESLFIRNSEQIPRLVTKNTFSSCLSNEAIISGISSIDNLPREEIIKLSKILEKKLKELSESVSYDVSSQEDNHMDDRRNQDKQTPNRNSISTNLFEISNTQIMSLKDSELFRLSTQIHNSGGPNRIDQTNHKNTIEGRNKKSDKREEKSDSKEEEGTRRKSKREKKDVESTRRRGDQKEDNQSYILVEEHCRQNKEQNYIRSDGEKSSYNIMDTLQELSQTELSELLTELRKRKQKRNEQQETEEREENKFEIDKIQTSSSKNSSSIQNDVKHKFKDDRDEYLSNNSSNQMDDRVMNLRELGQIKEKHNKKQKIANKTNFIEYEDNLFEVVDSLERESVNKQKNKQFNEEHDAETDESLKIIKMKINTKEKEKQQL